MTSPRAAALSLGLALALPRESRAEDAIAYKYEDYRESGGRIAVQTQGFYGSKDFGTETKLKLEGVVDAIAGATPTGQLVTAAGVLPTDIMHERRKAWDAELSHQFTDFNVTAGVANSRESDYVSTAWSLNTRTDFNQKNTTLLLGVSSSSDKITVRFQTPRESKRSTDYIAGVTQLVDPQTSLTFNAGYGRARGYLSDQYKLVEKNIEIVPGAFLPLTFFENRPREKEKWLWLVSLNRAFVESKSAIEATYRYYGDNFGIESSTLEFRYLQHILGDRFVLEPSARFYRQSAAKFYHYNFNNTSITPTFGVPPANGPFYSSDYRLSSFDSDTIGLKLVWNANSRLRFDAALERYRMHGRDHVTPQIVYTRATIATFGGRLAW